MCGTVASMSEEPCESWYALQVMAGHEGPVSQRLARIEVRHFVAMRSVQTTHKRFKTLLDKEFPLFKGYIFVGPPPAYGGWRAIKELEGVIGPLSPRADLPPSLLKE